MFWQALGTVISLFPKTWKPSFRPDSECQNSKYFGKHLILMSSRQCQNMNFKFCCFLLNKNIFKALSLWQVSSKIVFFQLFSVFLKSRNDFQRRGWIFELVLNHTHHKNTPTTAPERPSKLTVSELVRYPENDFQRHLQRKYYFVNIFQFFWCGTVGVLLDRNAQKTKYSELFSKGFCIARRFYFPKNHDFHVELYSVF